MRGNSSKYEYEMPISANYPDVRSDCVDESTYRLQTYDGKVFLAERQPDGSLRVSVGGDVDFDFPADKRQPLFE